MRIAIPIADERLAVHFGHCEEFALIDVDKEAKSILHIQTVEAPEHQPGLLPRWLGEQDVHVVLAGGMGSRAQALFAERGIQVITGVASGPVEALVSAFLHGTLQTGANVCDH